jgi:hypothetical protein
MNATKLFAVLFLLVISITAASAQIGSNYGNPCLDMKKGPNTMKTKKHDSHGTTTRFNAHDKALGNGNAHPYKPKQVRKNKTRNNNFSNKKRKNHKQKDRGDK